MKLNSTKSLTSYNLLHIILCITAILFFTGCGGSNTSDVDVASVDVSSKATSDFSADTKVLSPVATGLKTTGNESVSIDYSNSSEGYIIIKYTGSSDKVKVQLTGSNQVTYTYNITSDSETVLPLSADSGNYNITVFERIGADQYSTCYMEDININIANTFGPFLYPNQYVNFNANTQAVSKAASIAKNATCELEAVALIYDYVINNVTYDKEEASNVETSYLPDVDEVMSTGKGICFDYAALMSAMLRSLGIPTRLEIGYAKDAYHAWISVYTKDQGWIGGVIKFDGTVWTLMDPTLASNSKDISKIKDFIGDGSSYTTKYVY